MTSKLALTLALVFTSSAAQASAPASAPEPASVDAALAEGDLTAARVQVEAARKANPGATTWAAEAEVCERQADYACARTARAQQRALTAEGSPERAAAEARQAALEDMSRGTVADEPASTRRAELDARRAARDLVKPAPKLDRAPAKAPPRERIVKKWYFWVTILAIAASGAAITGIAVKAANDERPDSLDSSAGPVRLDQGFGLRF